VTDGARLRAEQLHSLGTDFLFGMLHRYTFDFTNRIKSDVPIQDAENSRGSYALAIHSRHNLLGDDGCDVSKEVACFEELKLAEKGPGCTLWVMTDRPCTISSIKDWMNSNTRCSLAVAPHDKGTGEYKEHGPFAGLGFFQDLAFVSAGENSAFIGTKVPIRAVKKWLWRSSSSLLLELIVFKRGMQAWRDGNDPSLLMDLDVCALNGTRLVH